MWRRGKRGFTLSSRSAYFTDFPIKRRKMKTTLKQKRYPSNVIHQPPPFIASLENIISLLSFYVKAYW
jgi:hypothetical protein